MLKTFKHHPSRNLAVCAVKKLENFLPIQIQTQDITVIKRISGRKRLPTLQKILLEELTHIVHTKSLLHKYEGQYLCIIDRLCDPDTSTFEIVSVGSDETLTYILITP